MQLACMHASHDCTEVTALAKSGETRSVKCDVSQSSTLKFAERRARPSLTRVAGHALRSGLDGASGGGIRSRGERKGARPDSCRPACERFAGDREAGFRLARLSPPCFRRGKPGAFGSAGEEGAQRGGRRWGCWGKRRKSRRRRKICSTKAKEE